MDYDFSQLNDKEFEILTNDLLSIHFNIRIERFKVGKDGGVDGRFFSDDQQEIIIQCKHYFKSGYKALIHKLITEEVIKVRKINPKTYILVTSLPLSRNNKKEIKNIFSPFIKSDNDIFGQEDLNDILAQNPKIEEKHFKLWITSSTVFSRLINNAIKGRSEYEIERIKQKSNKFVPTESYYRALKILEKNNAIIISGEPGIGKTTLAENLCLIFVSRDFEFITIEESLSEAENIYKRSEKQIFYFDDFLGSSYFEAIENKKDSHIMKFIERIQSDKTKLFILTSRTNILNSGVLHSSIFSNCNLQKNEFLLTIKEINALDRAKILYNHIWFSKLSEEFVEEIYKEKRYRRIISHRNFNPRLIDFITDIERINANASGYWSYIEGMLDNPKDIWNDCFKFQSNAYIRNLVTLTVYNGQRITEDELRLSYYKLDNIEDTKNPSNTEKDFNSTIQLATKSFLNREKAKDAVMYYLFNPSIADYILSEYKDDYNKLCAVFKSLNSFKSIEHLISLNKAGIISFKHFMGILDELFIDAFKSRKSNDYLIYVSHLLFHDLNKKQSIVDLLKRILIEHPYLEEYSRFFNLLKIFKEDIGEFDFKIIIDYRKTKYLEKDEITGLLDLMDIYEIEDEKFINEVKEDVETFLYDEVDNYKNDIDIGSFVCFNERNPNDIDIDESGVKDLISENIDSVLGEFNSKIVQKLDIDTESIIDRINVFDLYSDFIESRKNDFSDYSPSYTSDVFEKTDPIDDLFERS